MSDLVAAFFGARGQGKSAQVKHFLEVRAPPRLLIWDTMDEYREHAARVGTLGDLLATANAGERFALRYVPRGTDDELAARFEAFCSIAYELGGLIVVVEELQRVTRPSWAPASWSDCTLRGRHKRLSVIGISQRPASVDKNFFSNCNIVSTCRLNFADDVACMANVLGVPREAITALPTYRYIARDMLTGALVEGWTGDEPVTARARGRPGRSPPVTDLVAPRRARSPGSKKNRPRRPRR